MKKKPLRQGALGGGGGMGEGGVTQDVGRKEDYCARRR